MARACKSGRRCFALSMSVSLNDDNFRMGPRSPQSLRFFAKCNQCRGDRPISVADNPFSRCSHCRIDLDLYLFRGSNGILLPIEVLIVRITHQTCLNFKLSRKRTRRPFALAALISASAGSLTSRRITRCLHDYDSFLEINQLHRCERVARILDHEIIVLYDFIDENRRRRAVCNYCRR